MAPAPTLSDYLAHHPIEDADSERLLARAAAEILAGEGRSPRDEERAQYEPWTERVETPLFELADEPLEPEDVESLEADTRNAIYAICQVLARADGAPDPIQVRGLARLQSILGLDAVDAELFEDAAARHVLESGPTQPLRVDFEMPTGDWETPAAAQRHESFREERMDRLERRHRPHHHTGVGGPRLGVFGSSPAPSVEKG